MVACAAPQGDRRSFLLAANAGLPAQPEFRSTLNAPHAQHGRGLKISRDSRRAVSRRDDSFLAGTACPASQAQTHREQSSLLLDALLSVMAA